METWKADDISWSLGSCQSNRGNPGQSDYQGNQEYNQQCHFSTSPTNWVFRLIKILMDGDGMVHSLPIVEHFHV